MAAVARNQEQSVLTSLSELRAIEEQRVADERAAIRAAELADRAAREAAVRAAEEAAAARLRAEQAAKLAVEQARLEAEREARLKIEATEAAERTRQQAILAEARLAQELELRRAEVAKKRPTWMLAVTAIATLAAFALIYVAIDRTRASEQAKERQRAAEQQRREMRIELDELTAQLGSLQRELATLSTRTTKALDDLAKADSRAKEQAIAEQIRKDRARAREILDRQNEIQDEIRRKQRVAPVKIDPKCLKDALC